jgi:streptomycin 6-kinase
VKKQLASPMVLEDYLAWWELVADGELIHTTSSTLLPVRYQGGPAMLKLAHLEEEKRGGQLLTYWQGQAAVRVLGHWQDGWLLERALGKQSLVEMVQQGADQEASSIICAVVAKLHALRLQPPKELVVPLPLWFSALAPAAGQYGGVLVEAAAMAEKLIDSPQEIGVLHGDVHHGNVVDGGQRGWLAIDPKGLLGERSFDYANLFTNPDYPTATAPGRLARQAKLVAQAAQLDRKRLLEWVLAWAGLSAAWLLQEGEKPDLQLQVARLAALELAL